MKLTDYFLLFMIYSILGWICETIWCSILQKKWVLNRGFLIGPYLPIYGYGALFMILFLKKYLNDPLALFIMAALGASILEYITSYLMEKIFKARWWDYSDKKFHINGRICLENSILFGILGLIILYSLNPLFTQFLKKIPTFLYIISFTFLFITFLIDNIISIMIMLELRSSTTLLLKDSTESISAQVKEILLKNRKLKTRLLDAFPHAKILNHEKLFQKIRTQLKKIERKRKK